MKFRFLRALTAAGFCASMIFEYGLGVDFPLTPTLWLLIAGVALLAHTAVGQTTNSWTNSVNGTWRWEDASNWSLGRKPLSSDSIFITNSVSAMPPNKFRVVVIDLSTATNFPETLLPQYVTLSGPGAFPFATHNNLQVNGTGIGAFAIQRDLTVMANSSFSISNSQVDVGMSAFGGVFDDGTIQLTSGFFEIEHGLFVGYQGFGQMTISDGLFVMGTDVQVGGGLAGAQGVMTFAGGTNLLQNLLIGYANGNTGTVWVTGGQLDGSDAVLGQNAVGQMTVSNGTVQLIGLNVAQSLGSPASGTFTVAGGTVTLSNNLTIGYGDCSVTGMVTLTGGELDVTNSSGTAVLEIINGTFNMSGGILRVDKLVKTNSCAHFIQTGGTILLNPNLDADSDGIPNGWEQQYGLDPFDPSDAVRDDDGDGFSNLQEYLAGTNPKDVNSRLRILAINPQGDDVRIRWTTGRGRTNAVQASDGTANGSFTDDFYDLVWIFSGGSGDITDQFLDFGGATNTPSRFYRVRVVP